MGKQIRIYLADDTASGIRHAEITNWTGQALACPRTRFPELRNWDEIKRPGVYFLFGINDETGEDAVYIGESEDVLDRLSAHTNGKEFWNELIAFTSKDDSLTKGHIRYLESRLIELAARANRYRKTNSTSPLPSPLPRPDKDAMEEFLIAVRTLLAVLGHRVLEPYLTPTQAIHNASNGAKATEVTDTSNTQVAQLSNPVFKLLAKGIQLAQAKRTDEGLVVLSGSKAETIELPSLSDGGKLLRAKLIQTEVLIPVGGKLQFSRDYLFNSPSQAAAVIVGYSINGRDAWRLDNGTNFDKYEKQIAVNQTKAQ